jgi:peptidoglycan LD-endopeptidase LytH
MQNKIFLKIYKTLIIIFLPVVIQAQTSDSVVVLPSSNNAVGNFHFLYQSIREGSIDERVAQDSVARLLTEIKQYFIENGGVEDSPSDWVFPVEGYNSNMIGGKNGSDYIAGNYNFFNTSRIHVHPAHDIFIEDKNQDKLDDETNLPVNILSFTNGVVVSAEYFWEKDSPARGGNYIYIYEPFSRKIYYYAHNELVLVQIGDIVKAGQTIAVMGRSGFNAAKTRSPTHLHFSILKFDEQTNGIPIKPFSMLLQAKKTKKLR